MKRIVSIFVISSLVVQMVLPPSVQAVDTIKPSSVRISAVVPESLAASDIPTITLTQELTLPQKLANYLLTTLRLTGFIRHITIVNPKGETVFDQPFTDSEANIRLSLPSFVPGTYEIRVDKERIEDFSWGVLAINPNKALYKTGETADLAIGVLDSHGMMVCDAKVTVIIRDPVGGETVLSTKDRSIEVHDTCTQHAVTTIPDYQTRYKTTSPGSYQVTLTAETEEGTHTIQDAFTAEVNPVVSIERKMATRLFPLSPYPATLIIRPRENFTGTITETVPGSFTVQGSGATVEKHGALQDIRWDLSLKAGETKTLEYTFDPPDASPDFFLAGPLTLKSTSGTSFFTESRRWQMANDAPTDYSFQRKTWYDGTRYWRAYNDTANSRIRFDYSADGSAWTEDTNARISVNTNDFSVYGNSTYAYIAYKTAAVTDEDTVLSGSNIMGFWRLDESTTGTCAGSLDSCDASGYGHQGDWIGNAVNTTGKFNNGISLDGTGDYVSIAEADSDGSLDYNSGDTLSLALWINPTSLPGAGTFDTYLGKNNGGDGWYLQIDENGMIEWYVANGANWAGFTTTQRLVTTGSWQHIAFSQTLGTGSSVKLYYNGVSYPYTTGGTASTAPALSNSSVTIGANGDGSEAATGKVDDVRVYNTILTAAQIATLANPGYDIEVRQSQSYPGTGFSWTSPTIALNGTTSSDYYEYPTIAYDTNSKVWVAAHYYSTGTVNEQVSLADDDGLDVAGSGTFHTVGHNDNSYGTSCLSGSNCLAYGGTDGVGAVYTTGIRFTAVPVPQYATISSATFDIRNQWAGNFGTNVKNLVYGSLVSDLSTFSDSNLPRNVTKTSASATWNSASESIATDTWYSATASNQPPSITTLIQEVINQSGWAMNNSMGLLLKDNGSSTDWWFEGHAYENAAANAAKLQVNYTASQIMATRSTSANDITAWDASSMLDNSTNTNKYVVIVPRTTGAMQAIWVDGTAIESKNYNGTSWDGSPTSIGTGVTGLTTTIAATSDSSGNVHLVYIDNSNNTIYREYTSSWQTAVTLDSNTGNTYPSISLNSTTGDVYAFWIRSNHVWYKKGVSPYTSGSWDTSATDWQTAGTNVALTSNGGDAGKNYLLWYDGTAVDWDIIPTPTPTPTPTPATSLMNLNGVNMSGINFQ